jgi:hypothetical protein
LFDLHHGFLALVPLTEPWAFTLFVWLGFGALIDVMPRLPTIIAVTILGSTIVIVIVIGWVALGFLAAAVPYGTGNSRTACSEMGSPSSVQLKMTGEDPVYPS